MKSIPINKIDSQVVERCLIRGSTWLSIFGCSDHAQMVGGIVQIGLGILIGFSSLQCIEHLRCLNLRLLFDDVSILLVSMAVIVTAAPFPFAPKIEIPCNRILKWLLFAGLSWYAVFSAFSYAHFHRGVLWESADKPQIFAAIALFVLPAALLIIAFSRQAHHSAIPNWCIALLAFGLFTLPFSMQLGQLPICILSFIVAFLSAFLARGTKVLLLSATAACLLLFALSMADYVTFLPAVTLHLPRFGDALAGTSYAGHYLILIIAVSAALLFSRSKSSNHLQIYIMVGFFTLCLVLSQTRGAVIGLLSGLSFFAFQCAKRHKISKIAVVAIVLFMAAGAFVVTHLTAERQTGEERLDLLIWALQEFSHSPLIGNGVGSWHSTYTEHAIATGITSDIHQHCHNIVGEILCNMGLLGLLIFSVALYCGSRVYVQVRDALSSIDEHNTIVLITAGIFGYVVSFVVDIIFWYQAVMPIVPVLIGTSWGYLTSKKDTTTVDKVTVSNLKRCVYPSLLVAGMILISLVATRYLPTYYSSYRDKLNHKWFGNAEPGELPFGDIRGKVIDNQGHPVNGVMVTLKQPLKRCSTDKNGVFVFTNIQKRPVGREHLIEFYCKGYIKKITKIAQSEHGPTVVGIELNRHEHVQ